ncbi:MAG TPA: hypothetical protein DCZ95_09405 [Verrucomicrobia bacterium]|nr:MAG: hypothetical protein A2X46_06330 [Lentisphaerae bacterium GWF2_57_35]HBA84295.1 hypothetical protein [Verrucomicrobiota bacterium]
MFEACPGGERMGPPVGWLLIFVLLFSLFYLLHGERITPDSQSPARFELVAGDEPHYLLLTHSLVMDRDLNLLNNLEEQDYRLFYSGSMPDHRGGFASFWKGIVRGRLKNVPDDYWPGHIYSMCSPGLPVLLAPAYALGYWMERRVRYAVTVFMHALAALTGTLIVWLAWQTCRIRFWALFIGFALSLSGPLVFYSMSIYTDLPGALCLAGCWVLLWQWPPKNKRGQELALAGLGFLMGFMASLHTKFWMPFFYVLAVMGWVFAVKGGPGRALGFWALPVLLLVAGVASHYWLIFGVPYPVRTYPPFELRQALASGWPGLWLDRRHGLLWYLPLALFVVPGVALLARKKNGLGLWLGGLILLHWLGTGLFSDWTGGRCPPMRYWVPVAPLLAVPLAACVRCVPALWFRALFLAAGLAGVGIGLFGMLHPRRLYAYAHPVFSYAFDQGYARMAPLFDETWLPRNTLWVLCWIAGTAAFAGLTWQLSKKTDSGFVKGSAS